MSCPSYPTAPRPSAEPAKLLRVGVQETISSIKTLTGKNFQEASRLLPFAHQPDKAVEQIMAVARAGRAFRVILHREHRPVLEREAAVRAVEQRDVRLLGFRRQRVRIHRE